jgi:2-polyprenyl-3-methyl-5-hydroxy-6-metoxy-1,4-benzoquinol methylase
MTNIIRRIGKKVLHKSPYLQKKYLAYTRKETEEIQLFKQQLQADILEYLHISLEEYSHKVHECRKIRKERWRIKNPINSEDINKFYQEEKEEIVINLCDFNLTRNIHYPSFSELEQANTILDFGCGIGTVSHWLASHGKQVTLCDLNTISLRFAEWRMKKHKLPYKKIIVNSYAPLTESYDGIFCIDVIEHLINPVETVWMFHEHLHPTGFLFITNINAHPDNTHADHLIAYPPQFEEMISLMGFKKIRPHLFRKK